jgi:Flp pilus assembly protein TadG
MIWEADMLNNFWLRNDDGSVAVPLALAAVVLMAVGGMVLDFAVWHKDQTEMQAAADGAVLAAAQELKKTSWSKGKAQDLAKQYLLNNLPADGGVRLKSVTVDSTKMQVTLTAEKVGRRTLSSFVMSTDPTIRVKATAEVSIGGMPLCVLALDPSMDKALEGSGGTAWTANECVVHVNSSSTKAQGNRVKEQISNLSTRSGNAGLA